MKAKGRKRYVKGKRNQQTNYKEKKGKNYIKGVNFKINPKEGEGEDIN